MRLRRSRLPGNSNRRPPTPWARRSPLVVEQKCTRGRQTLLRRLAVGHNAALAQRRFPAGADGGRSLSSNVVAVTVGNLRHLPACMLATKNAEEKFQTMDQLESNRLVLHRPVRNVTADGLTAEISEIFRIKR